MSDDLDHLRLLVPIQQRVRTAVYIFLSLPCELVPSPIFEYRFDFGASGVRMHIVARGMLEVVEIDHRGYIPVDNTRPQSLYDILPPIRLAEALLITRRSFRERTSVTKNITNLFSVTIWPSRNACLSPKAYHSL